jgi:transposase-like protein
MKLCAVPSAGLPGWLPESARMYLRHTEDGLSIREIARTEGCHASTVLRRVRRMENRRDDPLFDEAMDRLGRARRAITTQATHTTDTKPNEEDRLMSAPIRLKRDLADEATVTREARRILRRLCEIGAVLIVAPELEKAAVLKGTVRTAVVDRTVAQVFALKDWIAVTRQGKVTSYEITTAGRATLKRLLAEDASQRAPGFAEAPAQFGDQHRSWGERMVSAGAGEAPRRVRYNLAESPLTALARRKDKDGAPFLTPEMVVAGERLREDFELAQMGPRVAQNWDRFLTVGDRGAFQPGSGIAEGPGKARDRVAAALRELGPGLGDMVLRCCCYLEGLEAAEKRMGWSARSGKIVLRIALLRLKRHYDDAYGGKAPLIG